MVVDGVSVWMWAWLPLTLNLYQFLMEMMIELFGAL